MIEYNVGVYSMCEYMLWSVSILMWVVVHAYWWLLRCIVQSENYGWCVKCMIAYSQMWVYDHCCVVFMHGCLQSDVAM